MRDNLFRNTGEGEQKSDRNGRAVLASWRLYQS